jgi:hypothetical protein
MHYDLHSQKAKAISGRLFLLTVSAISIFLLYGCTATTVLLANFNNDAIGSPPSATQSTGTVVLNNGQGSITVVAAPNSQQPSNKWAMINHPAAPTAETELIGVFSKPMGTGKYGLICSMHIPRGAGVVTVQFETFQHNADFMHLDFMPEGDVRIDDGNVRFGHFPRDTNFVLSVALDIRSNAATAEITLLGPGASGNITANVQPIFVPVARQFGSVKFWVGFQHQARFFVDDIVVTRKNN